VVEAEAVVQEAAVEAIIKETIIKEEGDIKGEEEEDNIPVDLLPLLD